eukprot:357688_1
MTTKSRWGVYSISMMMVLLITYFILFESLSNSSESLSTVNLMPTLQKDSGRLIKAKHGVNDKYSTYVCVGDKYHKKDTDRMISCHFTNMCFNPTNQHWTYYVRNTDDNKAPKDIIYDEFDQLLDDFWDKFLLFRHNPPTFWRPWLEHNAAPSTTDNRTKWFTQPTVLHQPFVMDNFGHCLGDNFYTIWHILNIFEHYTHQDMILLLNYNSQLLNPAVISNILKIYPYVMHKMPLVLNWKNIKKSHIIQTLIQNNESSTYNDQLNTYNRFCFKDFYIGTASLRLQRSSAKPFEWNRFIYNRFLNDDKHYALYNKYMMMPKQKILFLNKTLGAHRRRYANNIVTVCSYISDLFGVQVDILTDKDLVQMSLEEQINFVLEYSVLITPCGSLAFLGVFSREGTVMITMDWFNQIFNLTSHLESYLWEFETRKKTFYYYVTEKDMVKRIDDETIASRRISFHDVALDWSDYIIRPKRLAVYVHSALRWVENYNGWQNTFSKPTKNWIDSDNALNE